MTFHCDSCRESRDFDLDYGILVITLREGIKRYCRLCRKPTAAMPDVFWDGKPEINLADDERTGESRIFSSKAAKAAYLKQKGLQEAGDKVHGSYATSTQAPPRRDSRHEVHAALKQVTEMGRDRRRQEFLRITKQGRRIN